MHPFSWFARKAVRDLPTGSFRPTLESLGDRIVPYAGLWNTSGLEPIGVVATHSSDTAQVATHFGVVIQRAAYAGAESRLLVVSLDANNRIVKNFTGTISFASSDDAATLPDDYTFTAEDRGRKTFKLTLATEGNQTVTVTSTVDDTTTLTGEGKINVVAAPVATQFLVRIERAAYVGAETRVVVVAMDASNHVVPTYTGTVSLTSTDTGATLPEAYTFSSSDHGVHVFSVTPSAAGSMTVTATDTTTNTIVGSATTTVAEAPTVAKLITFVKPIAKTDTQVTVFVVALDANNRPVPTYTGTVALTSSDAAATLPAEYTFTASDRGIKSFTVSFATAGSQTITVTDTANGALVGTSHVRVIDGTALPNLGNLFGGRHKVDGWNR